MTSVASDPDELQPIRALLRSTARAIRWSRAAGGLAIALGASLGLLLLLAFADLVVPFGTAARVAALGVVALAATTGVAWGALRPLIRRLDPASIARRIESQKPELNERLVCCVDLLETPGPGRAHPPFQRRLVHEAHQRLTGFRPTQAIDATRLKRAAGFLLAAGATLAFAWFFAPHRVPTALARLLTPLADIPPGSGAALFVHDADRKVLRGGDVVFLVTTSSPDVTDLTLQLTNLDDGERLVYALRPAPNRNGEWRVTLAGYEHSFRYRVYGAGTWTREHRVEIIDRPQIKSWSAAVRPPAYLGLPEDASPTPGEADTLNLTAVAGSTIDVSVEVAGDAASGSIQLLAPLVRKLAVEERRERAWMTDAIPPGATVQGTWQWELPEHLGRPVHTEPSAVGTHAHSFLNAAVGFLVRPDENLFAWVWLSPQQTPRTVMLQFHDGQSWEHRAFWGEDLIEGGRAGTPGRRYLGPLPPAGKWVRLEVPAALVGLENRQLRGLSFSLHDGAAYWHRAGAVPPAEVESHELSPVRSFALTRTSAGRWRGSFTLEHDGYYRPELLNELGAANPPTPPARLTALEDRPPEIVVELPTDELVLRDAQPTPILVVARDDFGLADLTLRTHREGATAAGAEEPPTEFVMKAYPAATRSDRATLLLDPAALELQPGERLTWTVVVRDRQGSQTESPEFALRLEAPQPTATELQLAQLLDLARRYTGMNLGDLKRVQNLTAEWRKLLEHLAREHRGPDEPTVEPGSGGAPNAIAGAANKEPGNADAAGVDPTEATGATAALRLPPEVREEMLKGMRAGGPPGYEGFVRDYFERLTRATAEP